MRSILPFIQKPSHYAGIEDGCVLKEESSVTIHLALAFPDLYEVGMSYLGQKILYALLNARETWWAERVMAPEKETGEYLAAHHIPLATLESDTPLCDLDVLGFSVTHELCYTNILYMLDLAGIPLKSTERNATHPLVIAGGGALYSAEPLAPFMDIMVLGDGEKALPPLLELFEASKKEGLAKEIFLEKAAILPGIYVPAFFSAESGKMVAQKGLPKPVRVVVEDLESTPYPTKQVVPVGAVHNRLSLEIARGCTRGCRFCQAGMVYRPVRERSPQTLKTILNTCLTETGFDEVSFMALSTGDYSALKALSHATLDSLHDKQITLSLPSQRVGSIDDSIMARMADLRRTGMTLAPEAGSQRLRDVINKGISEEDLILHAQKLLEHGWRMVKLYFMIGLPTETDEDLLAIVDLCCKVRDAAGPKNPRLQVTAALSPFVPKPFTPFQWAAQIDQEEITRRVQLVRSAMKGKKCLTLRWHEPAVSHLEGILSRAGREMAPVVEMAYRNGAIFPSWMEHFTLEPWLLALTQCGIDPKQAIGPRDLEETLPWDHLEVGIAKEFLRREWEKATRGERTEDCRYNACNMCGACDRGKKPSLLRYPGLQDDIRLQNRLILTHRDQDAHTAHFDADGRLLCKEERKKAPEINELLTRTIIQYRIWHTKTGGAAFLSQLELQSVLERALRRADIPVAFSRGFHPLPLLSFGRALPVGVESLAEWFSLRLHSYLDAETFVAHLSPYLPFGMQILRVESVDGKSRTLSCIGERFALKAAPSAMAVIENAFKTLLAKDEAFITVETKKGSRTLNVRSLLRSIYNDEKNPNVLLLETNWEGNYLSPRKLVSAILGEQETRDLHMLKLAQFFADTKRTFETTLPNTWATTS